MCPVCLVRGGQWTQLSSDGAIWSFAVYERAFHPGFEDKLPYTVLLVELDEGPRMISSLADGVVECEIGDRVHAAFVAVTPDVTLVKFRLISSSA